MTQPATPRPAARPIATALGIDAVLVLVFAVIGRASHGEDVFGGLLVTAWPFLVGLALGWLVAQAWRAPFDPWRTGLPVWAITVAGGMLLRGVSDQGVQVAFIIVAASVLLVFLVGWRLIARLVSTRRTRP